MIEQLFEPLMMLGVHAVIAAGIVSLSARLAKVNYETALAYVGAVAVVLFAICIGVPFFFQGYADLTTGVSAPLGWTKNPAISLFAYLYTFKWTAFAWLSISITCVSLGRFDEKRIIDGLAKSVLVVVACTMLSRLDAFASTINLALE